VRLAPDEKRRFAAIASARGQSNSELGLAAVRLVLDAKMVYNIVLSMPAPTPSEKVLAVSRKCARELRCAASLCVVLHTDQANPHVHVQPTAIRELVGLLARLGLANRRIREHAGVTALPAGHLAPMFQAVNERPGTW
jgi:hypothetical protein